MVVVVVVVVVVRVAMGAMLGVGPAKLGFLPSGRLRLVVVALLLESRSAESVVCLCLRGRAVGTAGCCREPH